MSHRARVAILGSLLLLTAPEGTGAAPPEKPTFVQYLRDSAIPRELIDGFLAISGSRATAIAGPARSLEVTIAVRSDIVPWRYPPRLDFQYGDWFRPEYARGELAPWESPHPDLAIVLTTVLWLVGRRLRR